jgi:UDP-N-acetylmuramyl pentapeptide synthase
LWRCGERFDSNDFIEDVIAGGAAGIVVTRDGAGARRVLRGKRHAARSATSPPRIVVASTSGGRHHRVQRQDHTKNLLRSILATVGRPDRWRPRVISTIDRMPLTLLH